MCAALNHATIDVDQTNMIFYAFKFHLKGNKMFLCVNVLCMGVNTSTFYPILKGSWSF